MKTDGWDAVEDGASDVKHNHGAAAGALYSIAISLKRIADALTSGTLKADIVSIAGSQLAAKNLSASALGITIGAAKAGGTSGGFRTDLPQTVNGFFVGRIVVFTSGMLSGQASTVIAYAGATSALSVAGFTSAPSSGDSFVIL